MVSTNNFIDALKFFWKIIQIVFCLLYLPVRNIVKRITAKPKTLKGKICLITGSGRGLGREICIALAKESAIIACVDIHGENNNDTVQILSEMGAKAKAYKVNIANKQEVEAVCNLIQEELGTIYLLVNNAAIVIPTRDADESYTRAVFNVNILGSMWVTEAVLPNMKLNNGGHIVFINSIAAFQPIPLIRAYGSAKAALLYYSQAVRMDLKMGSFQNIRVTNVFPTGSDEYNSQNMNHLFGYSPVFRRLLMSSYRDIASCTVSAIKYNIEDTSPNPLVYYTAPLLRYIPMEVLVLLGKLLGGNKEIMIKEMFIKLWAAMPNEDTIQAGNLINNKERKKNHKV